MTCLLPTNDDEPVIYTLEQWRQLRKEYHTLMLHYEKNRNLNLLPNHPMLGIHHDYNNACLDYVESCLRVEMLEMEQRLNARMEILAAHLTEESALKNALNLLKETAAK